jgi:hypothetical protein
MHRFAVRLDDNAEPTRTCLDPQPVAPAAILLLSPDRRSVKRVQNEVEIEIATIRAPHYFSLEVTCSPKGWRWETTGCVGHGVRTWNGAGLASSERPD